MPTIFERVRTILIKNLSVDEDEVTPTASFVDDLMADSLDMVELIMALEEEFSEGSNKFEIPDDDAERIVTVQNAVDYLIEHGIEDEA